MRGKSSPERPLPLRRCPIYKAWTRMWSRARGTANEASKRNYLGRGIGVCDRWKAFENFRDDMGPRPDGSWLDRINNDLGYAPENCRWATPKEQQRNRRGNRLLTLGGETMCMSAWAERLGLSKHALFGRLRSGMTEEQALTAPFRKHRKPKEEVCKHAG